MANGDHGDSTVLYGVPRVSYTKVECTPFVSSLRTCLGYMGQDEDYARLMARSGAAFRLMGNTTHWDGGNVDILCMREDVTEPLRRALAAAGRSFALVCKAGKEGHYLAEHAQDGALAIKTGGREDFVKLVTREIDAGRPVIGYGIIGPPEACLITGYRETGEALLGWNFFPDMPEWAAGVTTEPCGYFVRRGWFEHAEILAVMAVGQPVATLAGQEALRDCLEFALTVMQTPRVFNHAGGFTAFAAWAAALLRESEFPKDEPLPMLFERLVCQV